MLSYYGSLSSEVYDMDKPIGHSFGDVEFYINRLETCKGHILEPATGTGRILIPLLEKGLKVDGFDSSKEMLSICESNCKKRGLQTKLFEARMEDFSQDKKYDAIIVPTGTFLLLHKRSDSIKALKNFYNHLSNGGRLILDIFLQRDISIGIVSTKTWECSNGDIITLENKVVEVDYINQYTISHGRYERWREGVLLQTELEHFPLRWYGVEEFRLILEGIGFKNIVISSDYNFGKYPSNTEEIITFEAVAIK
ncbi:Methyltransferase domain-containing protein [Tissierella praeacuta DSM 18095]|uniref:Methyltransferase domain-containing protein n=1 Tax=Tissierella praeacuta DSM 18095 TaxID=1123404 RepID=A0A1M4TRC4_9FIRM|nr:class I SAM-dependent methyltransferase [Tissierella praeacuta]TCU77384.1 methyltransferase family protein [Tissierella praeacuta]SHE47040.1 Methyltransferase domain-containing protein [Tissierella praeacuta DSM 18095]SUP04383.1 Glycine/sarcosine N-methyltransferase [Tissierella praeacuta]